MKKILLLIMMLFVTVGCDTSNSFEEEEKYTEQVKSQSLDAVGLPNITNFFEMAQLKEIYEMRDDPELILHWYTKNNMNGKWVYEGKCIGYGIPYGASITSPEVAEYSNKGINVLPQAEPNALYTNTVTSSATWVLALDVEGNIAPEYVEQEIRITPNKIDSNKVESWSIEGLDY